jgi:putative PIN family toxin of toxin-antitoxin system
VIRAVVDTNVFISALISPMGNEALILLAVRQGLVKPFFSEEILQEYVRYRRTRNSPSRQMKSKR